MRGMHTPADVCPPQISAKCMRPVSGLARIDPNRLPTHLRSGIVIRSTRLPLRGQRQNNPYSDSLASRFTFGVQRTRQAPHRSNDTDVKLDGQSMDRKRARHMTPVRDDYWVPP